MDVSDETLQKLNISPEKLNLYRPRRRKSGEPRCERDEVLDVFVARLNAARIKDGFGKLTHARVATALAKIPTGDLYAFYKQCDQAKSFSAFFWWSLKPKTV